MFYSGKKVESGQRIEGYLFQHWAKSYILWGMTNGVPNMEEVESDSIRFEGDRLEWIDVNEKDKLPIDQRLVLVKTDKGGYSTAYCHGISSGFITYGEYAYDQFGEITHWADIV